MITVQGLIELLSEVEDKSVEVNVMHETNDPSIQWNFTVKDFATCGNRVILIGPEWDDM